MPPLVSRRRAPSGDAGNTLILSLVLSAVAIALVLTFAAITQMQIERKRLLGLTDAAALHAASAIDASEYYETPGAHVPLTDASVREGVEDFLTRVPAGQQSRFHGLRLGSPTSAINGETAQVTLSAFIRPGYIPWAALPLEGFRLEVTSTARAD